MRAFNVESGRSVDRAVEETHHNVYDGPVVSVTTKLAGIEDTVRCTVYHPFWVVDGRDLTERSLPRNLEDHESEGLSIRGRWVNSHDLRPGDKLYTHDGEEIVVTKIAQEYDPNFEICNLTISQNQSFAVGQASTLVHNTSACGPIRFGENSNQIYHAFRHVDELGLDRLKVKEAIFKKLGSTGTSLTPGLNKGRVVVDGVKLDFHAFLRPNGIVNVGRITGPRP